MLPLKKEVRLHYWGKLWKPNSIQWIAHKEREKGTQFVGIVGGSRSGKSVWLINEVIDLCLRYPGFIALLSRWTDDATQTIIRPLFYDIARGHYHPDILGNWRAAEFCQELANGSKVYIKGLKSGDDTNRYAKFDGLSLGAYAISQAEELPKDVWDRLKTRLSQPNVPRHGIFELNPTSKDHYLHAEFEVEESPNHKLFHASVYDNKMNLPPGYIEDLEREYPAGHPLRHRLLEGAWGLTARGEPVIGPIFSPELHIRENEYDPKLPMILSYDPGVQHPALVWAQMTPQGHLRVLDTLLGSDVFADEFFAEGLQRMSDTFGHVTQLLACADRASQQRHGNSPKTEWDILREHLRPWGVEPKVGVVASKQFLIQRYASRFTRLIDKRPAIEFHPRCEYLIEAMSGGWVWQPPTEARPNTRLPKQDGWYEHGADALLYIDMHFGPGIRTIRPVRDDLDIEKKPKRRATAAGW